MIMAYDHDETIYNVVIVGDNKEEYSNLIENISKFYPPKIKIEFCDNYFDLFQENFKGKDVVMPDVDTANGKNFLFKINDKNTIAAPSNVCMILLGSDTKEDARMSAIDCGFEDYICKTLGINEFVSKIRFLLRKIKKNSKQSNKQILKVGDIVMNSLIRTVTICNRGAKISTKEFNILKLFLENPEKVFSREEILEKIWENSTNLSLRIVDVHINRLRIALGSNRSNRSYIRTVRGYGYSLDIYDSDYKDIMRKDIYSDIMSIPNSNNNNMLFHGVYNENF
jgi:DNA-binding response OmpR family regulator